jgi:hypothetical protein
MLADQLQRDGVILGQRFWRFGMATPVLSVEEGRSGFSGIFEIVAAGKAGGGRVEKETLLRAECRLPSLAGPCHPCCPIHPRHPVPAQRGEGSTGNDAQPSYRSTDEPTAQ